MDMVYEEIRAYVTVTVRINFCPVDRVVGVVIRCLGEVRTEMTERCSSADVVRQYERDLINPLVELTRSFVVAECTMSEQYQQYLVVADDVTYRTASAAVIGCAVVALAVARWLVLLDPQ